ncbi:glycosyltransferase [Salinibacter ruber]|uniref:glycosyltransferase n=1 Tax=Salinibacter ruber TaxID=146919 RepID=UPI0021677832|nr:glycosyltransferase [Salinibacter ruber]MCS4149354.1 cellulose synthase/poly-beta-1,6-N-acetylglucosamine synthase-like glycosyltransferase [Salinibacter ruber]
MTREDTTILIPTFKRPEKLRNCVQSILGGTLLPCEIVLVHRSGDDPTIQAIDELSASTDDVLVTKASVEEAGHIPPIEEGVKHCSTEFVCILDDDTVVKEHWLEELLRPFAKDEVGVVGGPAVTPGRMEEVEPAGDAGKLRFYGQLGGGIMWLTEGSVREVDTVPEGNSAWHTSLLRAIEIPAYLREGDSKWYGLYLTLSVMERGRTVVFNPSAFVHHYPSDKGGNLSREKRGERMWFSSRNYSMIIIEKMGIHVFLVYFIYFSVLGTRRKVGLLSSIYMFANNEEDWRYLGNCMRGRLSAIGLYLKKKFD